MAENRERPRLRARIESGMREGGSAIQFFSAVIGVLLIGVIIAVAVDLAIPNGKGKSDDPYKRPDPNWCNGCVLSAPAHIQFPVSG